MDAWSVQQTTGGPATTAAAVRTGARSSSGSTRASAARAATAGPAKTAANRASKGPDPDWGQTPSRFTRGTRAFLCHRVAVFGGSGHVHGVARSHRILASDALYHVVGKATGTDGLFTERADYRHFLKLLERTAVQFRWRCRAYSLLGNHYHLLVETPEPNLAKGMHRLNGMYAQAFNRRHGRSGHLFGDRYFSLIVDTQPHAMELLRYIALNPVRAGLTHSPERWAWSSYRATIGDASAPPFLQAEEILRWFSLRRGLAIRRLRAFVESS
jgi:REP element-mobilizing transposase RayT